VTQNELRFTEIRQLSDRMYQPAILIFILVYRTLVMYRTLAVIEFLVAVLYLSDIYRRLEGSTASNLRVCSSRIILENAGFSSRLYVRRFIPRDGNLRIITVRTCVFILQAFITLKCNFIY
jgi:hypothetical protein